MARLLLTGVAGFIGSHTAAMLLARGEHVVGVDEPPAAPTASLKEHRLAGLRAHKNFHFVQADLAAAEAVTGALAAHEAGGFDAVLHLAARAGVRASVQNPRAYLAANISATLNVLEYCREHGIPKLVLASTSSIYGAGLELPFDERQSTSRPLSPYAATKKAAEVLAHSWHALHGLDVSVLRYFTVYGPAGRPDMSVLRFVQRISEGWPITVYGDGSRARAFSYVEDIACGTIAALKPLGFEIINLGGSQICSVAELVALVERFTGRSAEIRRLPAHPADALRTEASVEKAARLLGWQPEISLEEGVRRTVEWYDAERSWAREIDTGTG